MDALAQPAALDCDHTAPSPCFRCGTFVCEKCQASSKPACRSCFERVERPRLEHDRRVGQGIAWSLGSGAIPFLIASFIGLPVSVVLLCAFFGGLASGVFAGSRFFFRVLFCIPGVIAPFLTIFLVSWFAGSSSSISFQEIALLVAVASLPGLLGWYGFAAVLARWELAEVRA